MKMMDLCPQSYIEDTSSIGGNTLSFFFFFLFFFFFPSFFFFFQHKEKFARDLFSERPLYNLRAAKQLRKAFAIGTKVKTNYTKEMIMDMKQARRDRYVCVYLGILVVYLCVCVLTFF